MSLNEHYFAVYVAVFEHKGGIFPGLTREFMRHSSVVAHVGDAAFDTYHVRGTPGIGLTYVCERYPRDP